jgi:hypothetical protein
MGDNVAVIETAYAFNELPILWADRFVLGLESTKKLHLIICCRWEDNL